MRLEASSPAWKGDAMKRFCEAFLKLEKGIGGALLLLMLVVVFFATVGRYTGL